MPRFSEGKTYLESCRRLMVALGVVVARPKHGRLPGRVSVPVGVCARVVGMFVWRELGGQKRSKSGCSPAAMTLGNSNKASPPPS